MSFTASSDPINYFEPKNYLIWFVMAFQAGVINVGGFLACHRFVTHTTGFATHFGADFANNSFFHALGMLSVPLFFLSGAMLAALLIDRRKLHQKYPLYSVVFSLIMILMLYAAIAGSQGAFGDFGSDLQLTKAYFLLAALSLASGLQNAVISPGEGSGIRTTHLTGLTTDIGVGIIRIFSRRISTDRKQKEILFNKIRMGIIAFFIFGSTLGAFLFMKYHYQAFYLPALIALCVLVANRIKNREP